MLATNELVLSYERLVHSIVNKYGSNYNYEDLYQVGMNKLVEMVPKYDPSIGVKFSTFVYKHVLGEILKYIREDKNIHVSRDIIALSRKLQIASDHFYKNFGYMPTTEQLSKIVDIEESKVVQVLSINQNTESLDKTYDYNDSNITLEDKIAVEEKITKEDLISLKDALNELDNEDRNLIYKRYFEDRTQTEIAKEMNISQVKVYRMEKKILGELNDMMSAA